MYPADGQQRSSPLKQDVGDVTTGKNQIIAANIKYKRKCVLGFIPDDAAVVSWTEVPVEPVDGEPFLLLKRRFF